MCVHACMCVCTCVHHGTYVKVEDNFVKSFLLFLLYVGSGIWTLVSILAQQAPLPAEPSYWPLIFFLLFFQILDHLQDLGYFYFPWFLGLAVLWFPHSVCLCCGLCGISQHHCLHPAFIRADPHTHLSVGLHAYASLFPSTSLEGILLLRLRCSELATENCPRLKSPHSTFSIAGYSLLRTQVCKFFLNVFSSYILLSCLWEVRCQCYSCSVEDCLFYSEDCFFFLFSQILMLFLCLWFQLFQFNVTGGFLYSWVIS